MNLSPLDRSTHPLAPSSVYEKAYFAAADMCDKLGNPKLAADFREWAKGSLHERELHEQRAKERNVEIKDMVPLKPTTDYTNLLTEAYEQKTLPDVTAAINPCGKLYVFERRSAMEIVTDSSVSSSSRPAVISLSTSTPSGLMSMLVRRLRYASLEDCEVVDADQCVE